MLFGTYTLEFGRNNSYDYTFAFTFQGEGNSLLTGIEFTKGNTNANHYYLSCVPDLETVRSGNLNSKYVRFGTTAPPVINWMGLVAFNDGFPDILTWAGEGEEQITSYSVYTPDPVFTGIADYTFQLYYLSGIVKLKSIIFKDPNLVDAANLFRIGGAAGGAFSARSFSAVYLDILNIQYGETTVNVGPLRIVLLPPK